MGYKEEIHTHEGGEALEQGAQRSRGCPVPRSAQDQVGRGFKQPSLVEDIPWVELVGLYGPSKVPSNPNLFIIHTKC